MVESAVPGLLHTHLRFPAGLSRWQSTVVRAAAPAMDVDTIASHADLSNLHGFELEREEYVQEYASNVALFRHKKTGDLNTYGCSKFNLKSVAQVGALLFRQVVWCTHSCMNLREFGKDT